MKVIRTTNIPKETSFEYGKIYQQEQMDKHRERHVNHWQPRIELAHDLINRYVLPASGHPSPETVKTLDVGCSIGTMAIEMAGRGFCSYGVDFDESALRIARELAREEQLEVRFLQCDVADLQSIGETGFDIAICFDIFEHLHDDELGGLLQSVRRQLNSNGALVFYTFPLQFDYLFFSRELLHWPLIPFKWLSPPVFERIVRAYAALLDAGLLLATGENYKGRISKLAHCNPTTRERLEKILKRAGFSLEFIESSNLYPFKQKILKRFSSQPIAYRHLYGVARPVND